MDRTVFRLYAHCIPVRGAQRSTVCDLQRREWHLVPNGLHEILTLHRDRTREELHALYGEGSAPVIDEYFAFLEENELGWWTDEPERFPPLDCSWDAPARVTNAIVDADAASRHDYASLFAQLEALGCRALQLRIFDPWSLERLEQVLALADTGRIRSLEVMVPYDPAWTDEALLEFCGRHPRLVSLFVHGAPERRVVNLSTFAVAVVYRPEAVHSETHCGEVHPGYFMASIGGFTEAQDHNSCLNRKLSVDRRGDIRNCPSMPRAFGNAAHTPLAEALERPGFRDLWSVTKDQVEVCRDCEFRYLCTDCRAYTRSAADGGHGKPAKCAYDPYTATWREEERPAPAARPALPVVRVSPVRVDEGDAALVGAP
jgi:SPASM domain peptide maturase of grasp-with-spasm system